MGLLDSVLGNQVAVFFLGGLQMLFVVYLVTQFLKGMESRMDKAAKEGVGEQQYNTRPRVETTDPTSRVLVVISGDDNKLVQDLTAFRKVRSRSGLPFTRLMPATVESLDRRLSRTRMQYGYPFKYVHISAHADDEHIQLDKPVDAVLLSSLMSGVEVLVLDGCETTEFGDLMGLVPHVVTLMESIDHDNAIRFAEIFWTAIGKGEEPTVAFDEVCRLLPLVSEYAYLHI